MKRVIALVCILGLFHSLPVKTANSVSAEAGGFKKLAVSAESIFVLNRVKRSVRILSHSQLEMGQFSIQSNDPLSPADPVDIAYDDQTLYVLDAANREVWCYSPKGIFSHRVAYLPQFLHSPTALCVNKDTIWIADNGTIWYTDRRGHVTGRFELPTGLNGVPAVISDITLDGSLLYAADSLSARIFVYTLPEQYWGKPVLKEIIGGYGPERGRFLYPTGLVVFGCLFVTDLRKDLTGRLTRIHPTTGEFFNQEISGSDKPIPEEAQLTDIVRWNRTIWCANQATDFLTLLEFSAVSPIKASIDLIDFGSSDQKYVSSKSFTLYSEDGLPVSGTLTCDNDLFRVHPTEFKDVTYQMFSVSPVEKSIQPGARASGKVTVKTGSGVTLTIEVRFKKKADKDFTLFYPGHADTVLEKDKIPLQVLKQNGLAGNLAFSLGTAEVPFAFSWESDRMLITTERTMNSLSVKPVGKPKTGFYAVPIIVKCPEEKIVKYFSVSFLYKAMVSKVPGTILGEYFAADWCPYCPSVEKSFPELRKLYSQDQILFMTYYNDCMTDTPARLCFDEGEERMKWYNPVGMHRIMVMNGTHVIESGYNDGVTTMTKEYDAFIKSLIPMASPVSLSGSAKWEVANRELTVGATLQATEQEKWDDLRLFCVLAEHGVLFDAENGMKEHHYVVRDLLALPNPEQSDAYGSPITGEEGSTQLQKNESWRCHLQTTVDPLVKMENAFCILFVQDIMTKQVYQSRFVPLMETLQPEMLWITERETVELSQNKTEIAKAWLVNRGNRVDQFRLEIFNRKPFMRDDTWKINGKEYPVSQTVSVLLNPMEAVLVEFSLAPGWGKPEPSSIELRAIDSSGKERYGRIRTTSLENKSRYQVLFPDVTILEEKGWTTDLYTFNCVLKTEPGTVLEGKVPIIAGLDGIMILPSDTLGNCIGKNSWSVTLRYPDTTSELVTFYFTRSLYIDLTIGSKEVVLNHAIVLFEGAPFIRKSRTMVPFIDIIGCFACGYKVNWDATTRGITIFIGDDVISFQVGVPFGQVNGREVPLDAPPEIVKNVTYIPLRFFAEALGAKVEWEAKTQTVTIR